MDKGCFLLAAVLIFSLAGFAQQSPGEEKIDPVLKAEMARHGRKASASLIFPCIIYTKHPEALRKKGIAVNSVLPAFVTAQLTGNQVFKLAKMPEVTYIESPKPDHTQAPGHDF